MSEALSAPTSNTASGETEAQRRRRVRQERILNRGGDRLGRIRETLGAAQEEADKSDLGIVGGHELKTETVATTHVAGISLDSLDEPNAAAGAALKPRRRAGNLGRKARLEAGNTSEDSATRLLSASASGVSSDPGDDISAPIARPAVRGADIDGTPLRDVVEDAIADPCTDTLPSGLFVSARRFSAIGLSRAVVKLVPVVGLFVYGINREARYERFVGDNKDDVRAKWTGLLTARPDSRLEEWASGNYLFWYLLILELLIYGAYFLLSDGRARPRQRSSLLAQIPGMPDWPFVLLSATNRIADSLSILLFLTAFSIALT
ncbi:hypothetical protein FBU31_002878 [Coemansia sp. 'formosensis']|nr:hypothetical protein FBU31_002878 [Coemansia sp. 'formosensis']